MRQAPGVIHPCGSADTSRALPGRDERGVIAGLQDRWFSLAELRFTTGCFLPSLWLDSSS